MHNWYLSYQSGQLGLRRCCIFVSAQKAALKAEKEGAKTLDIEEAKKKPAKDNASSGGDTTGGNTSGEQTGGTGSAGNGDTGDGLE